MCRHKEGDANIQKVVVLKPEHPSGRGSAGWERQGMASGGTRSSPSKALSKQIGQEVLKSCMGGLWLG